MRTTIALVTAAALLAACGELPYGYSSSAVHTVCGSGNTVKGIDVSEWQGTITWSSVKAAGQVFAFARVSDGTGHLDTQFAKNWPGMKQAGVIRGPYQFFRPGQSALDQAKLFVQKIQDAGGFADADLPAMIDVEQTDSKSASAILAAVDTWIGYVEAQTKRRPIIYTSSYFWDDNKLGTNFASWPLWTAHYTTASCPLVADPWSAWTIWQQSSKGSVTGITGNVDLDVFNGTAAELTAFVAASKLAAPAPDGGLRDGAPLPVLDGGSGLREGGGPRLDLPPAAPDLGQAPAPAGGCSVGGRPAPRAGAALLLLALALLLGRALRRRPSPH